MAMGYYLYHQTAQYSLISCNVSNSAVLINNRTLASCIVDDDTFMELDAALAVSNICFNRAASDYSEVMTQSPLDFLQYQLPNVLTDLRSNAV